MWHFKRMKNKDFLICLLLVISSWVKGNAQGFTVDKATIYRERLTIELVNAKKEAAMVAAKEAGQITSEWDVAEFNTTEQKWLERYKKKLAAIIKTEVDADSLLNSSPAAEYDYFIRLSFSIEESKGRKQYFIAMLRQYDIYNGEGEKVKTISEKELFKQFKKRKNAT
jgi:hypothetical protein